ncbi:hypothetical protein E0Z10_g1426 [Xylaria hypoxylon]|uniref:Uncharacterized protein n=1 Tax=Xylaria hypoxylon TaxID=37992 RepID=A0A4Z0Z8N0_9PEZI|nr:hypothetical protein E0Z10_g1426 [Xylaria hypoxylon]
MFLSSILASRGPSQLIIPAYHNIVDPEAVDVEDSEDDGPERDTRASNTGPLGSFRSKLIRRLSHRADAKAGSRPPGGSSDEELARRAELKRLMHKRIQEELKSEEEEEEDDLGLASLKPPSISNYREPELLGGGPRDTIEFSVSTVGEQEARKEVGTLPETSLPPTSVVDEQQEPCPRQSNCSELAKRSVDNYYHECSTPLDEMRSVISSPSLSHLTPVHLLGGSGRESPSTASWRLSYSAIHIESYIEPLVEAGQVSRPQSIEPGNSDDATHPHETDTTTNYSNPPMQNETIDISQTMQSDQGADTERNREEDDISSDSVETSDGRNSPLDIWLRSQDLHCGSISLDLSNTEMALQYPCEWEVKEQTEAQQSSENTTDLSGYKERTANSSSILQEHDPGTWPVSLERIASNESVASHQVLSRIENSLPIEGPSMVDQNQDVSSMYTSSRYTTRPNSQQATPRGSRPSLRELLGSRRILQPLSPIHGSVNPYRVTASDNSDVSSYRTALNKTPSSDHAKPNLDVLQYPTAEALSINASETASFRQREEELKSINKRFCLTPARQYPVTPMRSKFREEFEDPKCSNNGKSSILSKLYLAFPKRSRTSSSHTELDKSNEETRVNLTDFLKPNKLQPYDLDSKKDRCLPSNTVPETPMEERATGLWQRAQQQAADHRAGRLKVKLIKVSMPKANINNAEARSVPSSDHRPDIYKTQGTDETKGDLARNSFQNQHPNDIGILNEAEPKHTIGIHVGVLQEWVDQLQAEDVQRQSRTESRISVPKRQPPRLRTPPDSWAKWPSHTREERTTSAGKKDKVETQDFAVIPNSEPSNTKIGSKALPTGRDMTTTSRNLSSQVSKALRSGWNKMITHTGSLGRASDHEPTTQSTQKCHGFLEYPELELLPTAEGYREVEALDQQIDNMKRRSTSGTRGIRQSSSDGARRPLASRIAEEVHKFQVEGEDISWTDVRYRAKIPPNTQFLSPAHAMLTRRSKSFSPELLGAPESQCAYEDCVQTQMLDDGDDNNTAEGQDKTIIKRAKSTGNIKIKISVDEDAPTDHGTIHKTRKLGLRRHKSHGWIRGRGGGQFKVTTAR